MNIWATVKHNLTYKSSWKMLFDDDIFENIKWNLTIEKKNKNPETIPWNLVCKWKIFNIDAKLYIVEKFVKSFIQR